MFLKNVIIHNHQGENVFEV